MQTSLFKLDLPKGSRSIILQALGNAIVKAQCYKLKQENADLHKVRNTVMSLSTFHGYDFISLDNRAWLIVISALAYQAEWIANNSDESYHLRCNEISTVSTLIIAIVKGLTVI